MKKIRLTAHVSALYLLLIFSAATAEAQAIRTWVGGSGDDVNAATNCQRTAPCRTFAVAITKTLAGGEIDVADPGSFGAVTINKSVTIDGGGMFAGVNINGNSNNASDAILIQAPTGSVVVLRGLSLNGLINAGGSIGNRGIFFSTGTSLYVENCVIENYGSVGIYFVQYFNNRMYLFVKDTVIRNNLQGGILVVGVPPSSGSAATAIATIEKTRLEGNYYGVRANEFSNVTVRDSEASGSGNAGFSCATPTSSMTIENSLATHNINGLRIEDARMIISNVTSIGNFTTDVLVSGSGSLESYGNNRYAVGPPPNVTNLQR